MDGLLAFLAGAGLTAVLGLLLLGIWLRVAGDREDEHWPVGLDEDAVLDVQNHVGDSRPVR